MRNLAYSILLGCVFFLKAQLSFAQDLAFDWNHIPNQPWLAYNFWQNSLNDWKIDSNRVIGRPFFSNNRTAHITSHSITNSDSTLAIGFDVKLFDVVKRDSTAEFGVLIGAGSPDLSNKTNNLVFKTTSPGPCHFFGIKTNGELILKDFNSDTIIISLGIDSAKKENILKALYNEGVNIRLVYNMTQKLFSSTTNDLTSLSLTANKTTYNKTALKTPALKAPKGNIALRYTSNTPYENNVSFDNLRITGDGYTFNESHEGLIDPILSSFYTCTQDSLFFTAQLMPFVPDTTELFSLTIWPNYKSTYTYIGVFDTTTYQLRFRAKIPEGFKKFDYILKYRGNQSDIWTSKTGIIKVKPNRKKPRIMALNCNGFSFYTNHLIDYKNLLYPYRQIQKGFEKFKPDVVTFLGDQIYESRPQAPITAKGYKELDYLYKWSIWCYTFRDITKNQPTIILTDDHDVFQGNLWGNGGKKIEDQPNAIPAYYGANNYDTWFQDHGGYIWGTDFANMVLSSQTSHLPFPKDPVLENGLINYYTDYKYGKLNFAILEDKKFKSPPSENNFEIYNGFGISDSLKPEDFDQSTFKLLGDKQLSFLSAWSDSLKGKKEPKIILTQSAYVSLTTVPSDYSPTKNNPAKRDSSAQELSADMDTNGWPKAGRDRALNCLNQNNILIISGDQHLGAVVEVYDSIKKPYTFFSVPAIANTWPRMWWPHDSNNKKHPLGEYEDAFGNQLNVKAVANPVINAPYPSEFNYKSPGFGIIDFNKKGTKAKLKAYPLYFDSKKKPIQFNGWPLNIKIK